MSSGRTTHDKRQRERAKQAKAAEKRARRQDKGTETDEDTVSVIDDDQRTTEELLQEMEQLHASFAEKAIEFDDFDERKNELLDQIAVRLADGR